MNPNPDGAKHQVYKMQVESEAGSELDFKTKKLNALQEVISDQKTLLYDDQMCMVPWTKSEKKFTDQGCNSIP